MQTGDENMSIANDTSSQAGPQRTILVVDDEPVLLRLSVRHLNQLATRY